MNQNQEFRILGYKMQERCQSLHTIYILIINHSIRFFWIIPWIGQEVAKPSAVEAPSAKFGKSNRDSKGCPVTGDLGLLPASVCWNQSWIRSVPLVSECKQHQTTKQTETNLGHPGILKRMHSRSPECTCDSRYGLGKGLHPGDDGKGQAPAAQLSTLIHSLY